jgi:membrane-bound lytic murein transglycosylase B
LTHLAFDKGKRKNFYKHELQEFLRLCYRQGIEPRGIKGSASGAIGLAQFLPSNYEKIAVDFNNDGRKEMNNYEDAIASIAHYFKLSGWQKKIPVATRVTYEGNRFYGLKTGSRYKYKRKYLPNIYPKTPFDYNEEVHLIKLERADYDELWYGTKNFYALTRYNHSSYYAMAVHLLANKIKNEYKIALKKRREREYLVFN